MQDSNDKISTMGIFLHWLVGITIIGLIAVGLYMAENDIESLYPIHKSIGVILFIFIVFRVIRRIRRGWPKAVGDYQQWESVLSKSVHWILIIATLMFPISGMMMSGAGGHGISVFGLELLASNFDTAGKAIPLNATLAGLGHETHEILGELIIYVIGLHILAAFKHHFIDKNRSLLRMLGK
ncbi:MAG TPA: cytochrome b [Oceanospirillales bacterium]|nr:cytochrome b [Oceanospirillales bacterium]